MPEITVYSVRETVRTLNEETCCGRDDEDALYSRGLERALAFRQQPSDRMSTRICMLLVTAL